MNRFTLISRLIDPQNGCISLDNVQIQSLPISYLRRRVSAVPQNLDVLFGSIYENVTYGTLPTQYNNDQCKPQHHNKKKKQKNAT